MNPPPAMLPRSYLRYIWRVSARHQVGLIVLSVLAFVLTTVPLEFQRRIINDAIEARAVAAIAWLAFGYFMVALFEGLTKLALNVYRAWVSEGTVRHLRKAIHGLV